MRDFPSYEAYLEFIEAFFELGRIIEEWREAAMLEKIEEPDSWTVIRRDNR